MVLYKHKAQTNPEGFEFGPNANPLVSLFCSDNLIITLKYAKSNKNTQTGVKFVELAYLTCADIAKMTGKTLLTVQKWCRSGKLKAARPGGRDYLIKREDFEAFMEGK